MTAVCVDCVGDMDPMRALVPVEHIEMMLAGHEVIVIDEPDFLARRCERENG